VATGLAPVSRVRTLAAVKSLFRFCCRMRYLKVNPAAELGLPAYEKRLAERIVCEEDVQSLLGADMALRDQVRLGLLYTAGLRVSEAYGLRWRNLSARGDAGQITVFGKNGRTRAIALPKEVWEDLNKLRESAGSDAPVFASKSGQALDRGRGRAILRKAAKTVGVSDKTLGISGFVNLIWPTFDTLIWPTPWKQSL
jgi:integrase/recombinase XerD